MSRPGAAEFSLARATGRCAVTGRELAPGEPYFAVLLHAIEPAAALAPAADPDPPSETTAETNTETREPPAKPAAIAGLPLLRIDVAEDAWRSQPRPDGLFGYWRSVVPEPGEEARTRLDLPALFDLLRQLDDADEPASLAFRYVVGLILLRKKLLRLDATAPSADEGVDEVWSLTPKADPRKGPLGKWADGETITLRKPSLTPEQVREAAEQLGELLDL